MAQFRMHCPQTAPSGSQALLAGLRREVGFVPKVYAVIAGSPSALEGVIALNISLGASGFCPEAFLELQLGVAAKTIANFASKAAQVPMDEQFAATPRPSEFERVL